MSKESRTLFVRNLPYSATKEKLENNFSDFGPIKQCFIVNDRATGKSRGFGYVTFSLREDAIKTKDAHVSLDGRKLALDFADIGKKVKRGKQKPGEDARNMEDREIKKEMEEINMEDEVEVKSEEQEVESEDEDIVTETMDHNNKKGAPDTQKGQGQDKKYHNAKIVLLSGLPDSMTEEELGRCLEKLNVKQVAEFKLLGNLNAHIKFKSIRDVKRALNKLHNKTYRDGMLQACQLSKDMSSIPQHVLKMSRVIVRNLSFKCKDEDLMNAFVQCGDVTEVKIPTNPEGKMLGFGFVQFTCLNNAKQAIDTMNGQKILNRPVAVDWALPKDRYESTQNKTDDNESDEGSFSAEDEMSSDEEVQKKSAESSEEDEGYKDNADSEEDDEDDDDDDDDEGSDSDDEMETGHNKKNTKRPVSTDVEEGRTLFIRNLSFDCDEAGLLECFEQFGELNYAKVVIDHNTDHSKGMGFVKFKLKSSADECLVSSDSGSLVQDGRQLNVSVAVSRDQASKFVEKKEKEKKDNRNLYLAREGMIRPGTEPAIGLSKADLEKRMKVENVKRQKLKNINIFISPLRLCVRNIPATVNEKKLKEVFKEAAGHRMAKISECRIMRDLARKNSEGQGKSQGFGFISFSDHQHALTALRHTNNNPDIFGQDKRLIVEFSLENRKALEAKEKRKERFMAKQKIINKMKPKSDADKQTTNNNQTTQNRQTARQSGGGKGGKSPKLPLIHLSDKDKKLKGDQAKPKGMPSHLGAKIRHKPRESQQQAGKKQKKNKFNKPAEPVHKPVHREPVQTQKSLKRTSQGSEGPAAKNRKKRKDVDDFDKLVNNYKNKFMKQKPADSKWFDK